MSWPGWRRRGQTPASLVTSVETAAELTGVVCSGHQCDIHNIDHAQVQGGSEHLQGAGQQAGVAGVGSRHQIILQ